MVEKMAEGVKLQISNVLCFVVNTFRQTLPDGLSTVLTDFYTEVELFSAKDMLLNDVSNLIPEDSGKLLPRKSRCQGANKIRNTVKDILDTFTIIDECLLWDKIPKYVVADLSRVPILSTGALNPIVLSKKMTELEKRLAMVENHSYAMATRISHPEPAHTLNGSPLSNIDGQSTIVKRPYSEEVISGALDGQRYKSSGPQPRALNYGRSDGVDGRRILWADERVNPRSHEGSSDNTLVSDDFTLDDHEFLDKLFPNESADPAWVQSVNKRNLRKKARERERASRLATPRVPIFRGRNNECPIKSVPLKSSAGGDLKRAFFVSGLDEEVRDEDLQRWLVSKAISVITLSRIDPKKIRRKGVASFHICVKDSDADKLISEDLWALVLLLEIGSFAKINQKLLLCNPL